MFADKTVSRYRSKSQPLIPSLLPAVAAAPLAQLLARLRQNAPSLFRRIPGRKIRRILASNQRRAAGKWGAETPDSAHMERQYVPNFYTRT